ncbi:ABC transporter transmembrane region [Desulfovibrio sp. X2]|uniref:ABC transporter ATP-binding protein/permease n=1 Tax=Desulfovibrio sp. X2 TaxID=941449 RepID=UPI000358BEA8|nr:ABC transporter transmembrane domain-containing protein [Desulfovibrio sp. X2]EPR41736.1 ABC transporter transmembrane region [Desulfovibrio sp. X2]
MEKGNDSRATVPVTKRSLFSWVWASNLKLQLLLLVVIVITVFARVLPLELQKKIINEAIGQRKLNLLLMYCGYYLAAVVTSGALKYVINLIQTHLGQRALADLRKALYEHILTLPLNYFRKTQAGMVVSSLVTEIVPVGDFVGMALGIPVTNVLTLFAFGGYLFYLNWKMACISMAIYPFILLVIPRLQRKTNRVNKRRVDATREISSSIAEAVTGIHEIHGNGSYILENRKFGAQCDSLEHWRIIWNLYKLAVKAVNNLLVNLAPFTLFLVGGYLIIKGQFDLGALVAFLSAQEKLFEPWSELMEFYQVYQDSSVRYARTLEYFDELPEHAMEPEGRPPMKLDPRIEIEKLSFVVDGSIRLLSDINLKIGAGEHLALVGFSGSGKSTLALCIGQLYKYTSGSLRIGGQEVDDLSRQDMAENIGFVSQAPFIFTGTIRDNLLYACEAELHGAAPVEGENMPSLDDQIAVLQQSGIFVDVLRFGLGAILPGTDDSGLAERIIRVRENFRRDYGEALADNVEFFEENSYLVFSSVAANLTFGSPTDPEWAVERLPHNEVFQSFLDEVQLGAPLLALGAEIAQSTVDILGNLPKDAVFFEQSPIPADAIDDYKDLVRRMGKSRLYELALADRARLVELALNFTPGRHKMVGMPLMVENMILEARARFRARIEDERPGAFSFYRQDEYLHAQTILDNILFGKAKSLSPQNQEKINQSIIQLLIEEDLLETIVALGMEFQVGSKGDKLSGGQRQKLAIARCFLKQPRILIMDEATSALDNKSQARIQNILETRYKGKSTLVAVVHRLDIIKNYDKVAVMKAGKIVECDTYPALMAKKGGLYELVHGKK